MVVFVTACIGVVASGRVDRLARVRILVETESGGRVEVVSDPDDVTLCHITRIGFGDADGETVVGWESAMILVSGLIENHARHAAITDARETLQAKPVPVTPVTVPLGPSPVCATHQLRMIQTAGVWRCVDCM